MNNAGRQQYCESIEQLSTAAFDATFKTNVYAPFWITKAALRHLSAGAVIINTSSVQAFKPSEILLDYAQTKACNVAFTKSTAQQLGPRGIRVNAVALALTGHRCSRAAASRRRRCKNLVRIRRLADRDSRLRLRRFTSFWLPTPAPTLRVRSGAQMAVPA